MKAEQPRFVGGMNLARPFGRLNRTNATIPLAVMTIDGERMTIAPIRPLARALPHIALSRSEVIAVSRSTGVLTQGVAVKSGADVHFFWTFRSGRVIAELGQFGYPIAAPQRPSLWRLSGWSRKPID